MLQRCGRSTSVRQRCPEQSESAPRPDWQCPLSFKGRLSFVADNWKSAHGAPHVRHKLRFRWGWGCAASLGGFGVSCWPGMAPMSQLAQLSENASASRELARLFGEVCGTAAWPSKSAPTPLEASTCANGCPICAWSQCVSSAQRARERSAGTAGKRPNHHASASVRNRRCRCEVDWRVLALFGAEPWSPLRALLGASLRCARNRVASAAGHAECKQVWWLTPHTFGQIQKSHLDGASPNIQT